MPDLCDILIVGGGVIGLSIARELAAAGLRVSLLDRQACGREASWAGAGILPPTVPGSPVDPLARLTAASHALWPGLSAELRESTGIDNGYRACGGLTLAGVADEVPEISFRSGERLPLQDEIEAWRTAGAAVVELDGPGLIAREPALASGVRAGFSLPDLCQVRNPWHLRALLADCRRRGVQIEESVEVREVWRDGERVRGVVIDGGRREAGHVVIAGGAWSQSLLPPDAAATTPVTPVRGQMLLLRTPKRLLTHVIECGHRYLVPRDDGRVLAGSTEELAGYDRRTTPEGIAGLLQFATAIVPALQDATQEQSWAGLRPYTPRGIPCIGPVPGVEGLYLAAGHFRSGLHLSAITARLIRNHILGEGSSDAADE